MKTKNTVNYGELNAPCIGMILKDLIGRASRIIRKKRANSIATAKVSKYKKDTEDFFTDADTASQELFERKLTECFPGYGIVAEENDMRRECTLEGRTLFFTVDPLDGTKAFTRRQSHGFGPMLSLSTDTEVIAAFVGDTMSEELYYYRPESSRVHRFHLSDGSVEDLKIDANRRLADQYVQLREDVRDYLSIIQQIACSQEHGGIFKNIEIAGGGLGTWMARLWKSEVGAGIIQGGSETPWDILPVYGISKKLGFSFFYPTKNGWDERIITPSMETIVWEEPTVILHESRLTEFLRGVKKYSE